jgi:O-methyltransferase
VPPLARRLPELIKFAYGDRRLHRIYNKYKDFTMITADDYVENLRLAMRIVEVRGSIIECGTWRGGMIAGIADLLGSDRRYYLFDSFQGLPLAKEIDGVAALAWQSNKDSPGYYNNCTASKEEARAAMSASAAKNYQIIEGWFDITLRKMSLSEPIALLRMDADWYESTRCILDSFASSVAPGGLIVVDDYYTWEGCTKALNEVAALRNWRIRQSRGGICFIIN